jgi:hypothetical protein
VAQVAWGKTASLRAASPGGGAATPKRQERTRVWRVRGARITFCLAVFGLEAQVRIDDAVLQQEGAVAPRQRPVVQ